MMRKFLAETVTGARPMTPGQRWNALMDTLSYPMRLYLKVLGIGPVYGLMTEERIDAQIARVHEVIANTDPTALHVPPPIQVYDPYQKPFRPTHIGRKGSTLVEVMHRTHGMLNVRQATIEYRTRDDRTACSIAEFDRLFKPLGPQLALFDLVGPHFLLDPLRTAD